MIIQNKKDLRFFLKEDMKRNLGSTNYFSYIFKLYCKVNGAMAYHYMQSLRRYEYALNCSYSKTLLGRLMIIIRKTQNYRLGYKYSISIHPNTVGYGLYLPHTAMGGVVINCKKMGNYCTVNTGCVIGKKDKDQNNTPTIGNYVTLNPNSTIIGKINVGNYSRIAPQAVVTKDVPEYAIVAGVPGKVLKYLDHN